MNRILIVDDDIVILETLKDVLTAAKYNVIASSNPVEALKIYKENPTLVVITDLIMNEMSGRDLMIKLFETGHKPLVIILTRMNDSKTIIDLFKSGAHDYTIKPFAVSEIVAKVNKAFELAELRIVNENLKREREIRFENQFKWNIFRDNSKNTKSDIHLIDGIKTSFLQGSGIGALVPIIDMIKQSSKEEGEVFLVKKKLLKMLFSNAEFLNRLIEIIADIDHVSNMEIPKEKISIHILHEFIETVINDLDKYAALRNHSVVLTKNDYSNVSRSILLNKEYFRKALQELLLNAFKFSEEGSKIFILFEVIKEQLFISILNHPDSNGKELNGILPEFQALVFEPFFRISRYVHEEIPTLDFGLGLCFVDRIIRNHNGKIKVGNIKNHTNPNGILINFTIEIPFAND